MSQIERVYKIDRLLRAKVAPGKEILMERLQVSEATLKRDLEFMRSRLGAPIRWCREANGYRYEPAELEFNLPGCWFSADELRAFLLITSVIDQIQPGFLQGELIPFQKRLKELAQRSTGKVDMFGERVCFIPTPVRLTNPDRIETIACATLTRRRVEIEYESRSRGVKTKRLVSPAKLIYYRGQWYVDAWCHSANEARRFAVDAVTSAQIINEKAFEFHAASTRTGYGIFNGEPVNTAVLHFSERAARWIRSTQWHLDQKLTELPNGMVSLEVPYSHTQEIMMEILRYGTEVEVVSPKDLRQLVANTLREAANIYLERRRVPGRDTHGQLKPAV